MTILQPQLKELFKTLFLHLESKAAIEWFKWNEMIVNPEKCQAIVVKKNSKIKDSYPLNINDLTINSENSIKFLGIEILK